MYKVEDVFPEDPFEPTVKYIGASQTPFTVPWTKERIQLCAGFNTQRSQKDALFLSTSAFQNTLHSPLQYRECQSTSIKDESGSNIATSSVDTTFAISASVGGSFLGASGRGSYEKNLRDNKNTSSITIRAEHTCGQIEFVTLPDLSPQAILILRTSPDPIYKFRETYGDFYVAGYRLGAVNNTTISGTLANKSFFEAKRAELKIKAFFVTVKKSINDVSQSGSDEGGLGVTAFDSLSSFYCNFTAHTYEDSIHAGNVASENKQKAMDIARRTAQILCNEFILGHEGVMYEDTATRLCDRGLVTDLLLAPFASLREYQSLLTARFNRHGK